MTTVVHLQLTICMYNNSRDKIMNNLGAYNHLQRHNANVSDATKEFLKIFQITETEYEHFRYRFRDLVSERVRFREKW